nr:D111 [uncultured bacterium]
MTGRRFFRLPAAARSIHLPNAKVSGGGTPSAALPGYAGDNNNNGET